MKRSKIGVFAAVAAGLLFAAAGATAAHADNTEWIPDSYLEFIPRSCSQDGAEVRADAKYTIINNEAIVIDSINGVEAPEFLEYVDAGPGVHSFEYHVLNLAEAGEEEYPSYPKSGTFTVDECVEEPEPQAPIVDAVLTGILENNKSAVYAVVTVVPGDAEGTLIVKVTGGGLDQTLEFPEGTETLRATYPVNPCGEITFTVGFAGQAGTNYVVNVPCPVTDGGDPDGGGDGDGDGDGNGDGGDGDNNSNTGGNTGGSNNGNTSGGTTNPGTQPGTTTPVNTDAVNSGDYDTGDAVLATSATSFGYTAGGITALLAAVLVAMGVIRSRRATVTD